jgi:hypothetical protein
MGREFGAGQVTERGLFQPFLGWYELSNISPY